MQILRQWQVLTAFGIVFGLFFSVHFAELDEQVRLGALSILGVIGMLLVLGVGIYDYIKNDLPYL